ncbi:DUF1963 domain-containing protein [Streptomyces phyllanthi]|uniref:DUF1963 domain-containing protein n=1 Tax=Streptomyces phyllanthi TaxID=1803180 RepID=A0A5N8WA28_9ACTN|nr:YwqG family protein [Streptomyces phyllanthi]MPY43982.1 DUF1963 domain-containing protein [Streptomyces phyllanthi]
MSSLKAYREAAREQDIPEHIIDRALRLARPRIELRPKGDSGAPVAGHYGGHPRLPPDVEWSGYPDLIASVDCAAVPVGELDIPLPQDGHLLFFADRRLPDWAPATAGRVVYVPAGTVTAERIPSGEHRRYTCEAFPLRGRLDWRMPGGDCNVIVEDEANSDLYEEHGLDLDRTVAGELTLGGYPCPTQSDPCSWPDEGDEAWILLAQADYEFLDDPHTCAAYWLIRRGDLAARNFDDVRTCEQSWM